MSRFSLSPLSYSSHEYERVQALFSALLLRIYRGNLTEDEKAAYRAALDAAMARTTPGDQERDLRALQDRLNERPSCPK